MLVPILIGVALIFMGGASMFYGFQANKTERILKKQADQTSFKEEEPEEDNKVENDSKDSDMVDVSKDEKKEGRKKKREGEQKKEEKEEKKIINSYLEATLMKSPIIKQSVIFYIIYKI